MFCFLLLIFALWHPKTDVCAHLHVYHNHIATLKHTLKHQQEMKGTRYNYSLIMQNSHAQKPRLILQISIPALGSQHALCQNLYTCIIYRIYSNISPLSNKHPHHFFDKKSKALAFVRKVSCIFVPNPFLILPHKFPCKHDNHKRTIKV